MTAMEIEGKKGKLTAPESAELSDIAARVRGRLQRSAADLLAIGAELIRAKSLLGHGHFGEWLDAEFALSRRSAEQFMAAARRFEGRNELVSHLPAGAVLELSSPSVSDELVDEVLSGRVQPSASAIKRERSKWRSDERAYSIGTTFIDHLSQFEGTNVDFAVGVAAEVLRTWADPDDRGWFVTCLTIAAEMIEENRDKRVPLLESPRATVRRLKEHLSGD